MLGAVDAQASVQSQKSMLRVHLCLVEQRGGGGMVKDKRPQRHTNLWDILSEYQAATLA